ncbi:hypothetical protein KIPB_009304 [Kipferlia bialata]|uniref:Heat shock protein 70 family n=1 Tax=Kipferlia bialata TaxID=797122 RepID=A0A9K3GM05_9EUKA|nr:hypothetical protein KIPB_009304 [Kipferlia bialata]|eukprot:g9304.t1
MSEVTRGHGHSCGATFLDTRFLEWVRDRFGDEFYDVCTEKYPSAMATLVEKWEGVKRRFSGKEEVEEYMTLPGKIGKAMPEEVETRLENMQDDEADDLVLLTEDFKAIFDPVVDEVIACVVEQFRRLNKSNKREGKHQGTASASAPKVDVMLLVGGFNASPYLVSRIRDKFRDYAGHIIAPMQPGSAVVIGAVHYGSRPTLIKSRVSRYSYGVPITTRFDPGNPLHVKHSHRKQWNPKAEDYWLHKLFAPFVRLGESVPVGMTVERRYFPMYSNQTVVSFQVLQSNQKALFTDEPSVQALGDCTSVNVPLTGKKGVTAKMHFGGTEIRIDLIPDDHSYEAKSVTVQFKSQDGEAEPSTQTGAKADEW